MTTNDPQLTYLEAAALDEADRLRTELDQEQAEHQTTLRNQTALSAEVQRLRAIADELRDENLRLREQIFAQKPVVEAAQAWAEMCEDGGIAPDDCRKSEDALFDAVESYRLMGMALTSARAEDEEDVRCDHGARLDVECRPCLVETYGQREAEAAR